VAAKSRQFTADETRRASSSEETVWFDLNPGSTDCEANARATRPRADSIVSTQRGRDRAISDNIRKGSY